MPFIKERSKALEIFSALAEKKISMGIFCTASHWNTEAVIKAASDFAGERGIKNIPVTIAMTYNYRHMSQATRITYSKNPQTGFLSVYDYVKRLTDGAYAPYPNVCALLHLDHADPEVDEWALEEGAKYLTSAMFDAQRYPVKKNIEMTKSYVERHGKDIIIEGIMDELSVLGSIKTHDGDYAARAVEYFGSTGIDFLVADLGTEQQSTAGTGVSFLRDRALEMTKALGGKPRLVLHGTSSLDEAQMRELPHCGIARVNMWTRIVRESGQYAGRLLRERAEQIEKGEFEATEANRYIRDNIEYAAGFIVRMLDQLGYGRLR